MNDKQTCPTCGSPVKVVGGVTKSYEPILKGVDELRKIIRANTRINTTHGMSIDDEYLAEAIYKALGQAKQEGCSIATIDLRTGMIKD